jgi:polyhydroxybutyrate depolymerase
MLTHDGQQRTYLVHVPASYTGTTAVPLVLDIHGLTSSATAQKGLSGWVAKSDSEGFIVIHPNGLNASWNGGELCCGTSQRTGVDDVGFMRAIVAKLQQEACIDPKRVYATGLSNGGAMSHRLACEAADLFAATAPVSMGNGTRPCQPSRPISVTMFRGTSDTLVAYNGGLFPSAQADFDQWKGLSGCTGSPAAVHNVCQTYTGCGAGTEVTLCTINGGHVLYSAAAQQQAPVPDVVWEMFSRQRLP